jgi:hypothetical protein
MRLETAFEKRVEAIFVVTVCLSTFCYLTQAYLKKRHPLSFPHIERFVTYLSWVMMPFAAYQLFLYFRYAGTASRLVIAFLAFVGLIGLAARWWTSRNKTAPSQS